MNYYIKGCPIPFHDLIEIFEFLSNLSPVYLYQYQFLDILVNGVPRMYIYIIYKDFVHYITYICYH